jgi:hypothetical protein
MDYIQAIQEHMVVGAAQECQAVDLATVFQSYFAFFVQNADLGLHLDPGFFLKHPAIGATDREQNYVFSFEAPMKFKSGGREAVNSSNKDLAQKDVTENSTSTYAGRKFPLRSNYKRGALQMLARRAASTMNFAFAVAVLMIPLATQAGAQSDKGGPPLVNCEGASRSYWVDFMSQATWCFDGPIGSNLDLSVFRRLKADDRVVMRSEGGDPLIAMRLSDILREKNVAVILYDYCLAACADFVFVANRTFVKSNTIVAWNGDHDPRVGVASAPWCSGPDPRREPRKLFDQNGVPTKEPESPWCEQRELIREFFQSRGLDGRYVHAPPTDYTKKKVQSALTKEPDGKKVFWMWNPKNYGDYFKSKVSFQDYPHSQKEVDRLVTQFKLGVRVVFDP